MFEGAEQGACQGKNPDLFFRMENADEAKAICRGCPVLDACREYALAKGEKYGVWGGMSERDRIRLMRRRAYARRRHGVPVP